MAALPRALAMNAPMDLLTPQLALYVHLPWCVRKCPYCDFNSYEARGPLAEDAYVAALLRDLDGDLPLAQDRPLASVFIGGGTPSLFSGAAIARLLEGVRARLPLSADIEITLEANPGAIDEAHFSAYQAAGVSRLSIGVQSFRSAQLQRLGRVHDAAAARAAVQAARRAGFRNVNLDLMYGLPDDDLAGALEDLRQALDLGPEHVSWYQLTLEPNTAFHRKPPPLPDEDRVLEIEHRGRELLASSGFARYEISAYAQPGRRCIHNLNYWRFGDYLGLGAGAHGKITRAAERAIERRAKQRNPRTYRELAGTPAAATVERIDAPRALALECLMNVLRLPEGIASQELEARTGEPWSALADAVNEGVRRGWLAPEPGVVRTTPAGAQMLNALLELF